MITDEPCDALRCSVQISATSVRTYLGSKSVLRHDQSAGPHTRRMGTNFVSITTDSGNTVHPEVEGLRRKSCPLQERHNETPETAVHVEANIISLGKSSKTNNIILAAIGEIDSGTHNLAIV
jgi:hypothetical protein